MKKKWVFFLLIYTLSLFSQSGFEQFKSQQEQQYQQYEEAEKKAHANYFSQQDSMFIQYKEEIEKLWNEFLESTPTNWVSYNSNFNSRSQVDFENSEVTVESVVDEKEVKNEEEAKEILKQQLVSILKEKDKATQKPILLNQVASPEDKSKPITPPEVEKAAEKIVAKAEKHIFKDKEGNKKTKYVISIDLIPKNIQVRVDMYKPLIEKYCQQHDIEPKLAMAIIHTESFYNPKAYNRHGNAYGMMQIVPAYAGKTMNYTLYKNKKEPNSKQLYDPKINLNMGIGYLRWLADNKWQKITNKDNQRYCVICSYNGGPGSIYKAMTGKMRKIGQAEWDKMINDLNTMDTQKLYNKLHRDIPWAETRKYIKLVRDRMEKYYKNL
ncbi:MAG: murein transglycosylase domain-containing protein [Candidatus Cloacimonadota bacterium]|nr:murein transglycosylase domain-containing protein [Candidatus Cloacimonadota bacterium]